MPQHHTPREARALHLLGIRLGLGLHLGEGRAVALLVPRDRRGKLREEEAAASAGGLLHLLLPLCEDQLLVGELKLLALPLEALLQPAEEGLVQVEVLHHRLLALLDRHLRGIQRAGEVPAGHLPRQVLCRRPEGFAELRCVAVLEGLSGQGDAEVVALHQVHIHPQMRRDAGRLHRPSMLQLIGQQLSQPRGGLQVLRQQLLVSQLIQLRPLPGIVGGRRHLVDQVPEGFAHPLAGLVLDRQEGVQLCLACLWRAGEVDGLLQNPDDGQVLRQQKVTGHALCAEAFPQDPGHLLLLLEENEELLVQHLEVVQEDHGGEEQRQAEDLGPGPGAAGVL
mmetsp:Transcript_122592/g.291480  ORF Transcript_122592/g.291480 Transcript_122592/m.291480 type:complete len:337 (-) Transcript_122592:465-1475(-)